MQNKFKEEIKKINQATSERYNKRLQEKGEGAYALGWGKKTYQLKRFFALLHATEQEDFNDQSVLDIGCGFADLYPFLKERGFKVKKYIGVDINKNFIDIAEKKYPECLFEARDPILEPFNRPIADTGIALGVINFKQKNHEEYAYEFIKRSFNAVRNVLIINVISDVHNENYPREPFIYYFKPDQWLALAQKITPYCSLIHDYKGEPQHEFMLVMRKKPWRKK